MGLSIFGIAGTESYMKAGKTKPTLFEFKKNELGIREFIEFHGEHNGILYFGQ